MAEEYLASNEFPGDGVTTLFNVSFKGNRPDAGSGVVPYLNAADVKAQVVTPATSSSGPIVVDVPIVYVGPNQFSVTPATPVGKITRIYRATQDEYALVNYQALQTVGEADLDLSNRQVVFIVQEAHDLAVRASIVAADTNDVAYNSTQRSLRVPEGDDTIEPLPDVAGRANKMVAFNAEGNPIMVVPTSGSAVDLAIALADQVNPLLGSALVGYQGNTVSYKLSSLNSDVGSLTTALGLKADAAATTAALATKQSIAALADAVAVANGAGSIGRGFQAVDSIASLKLLDKNAPSKYANTLGYYLKGDGGAGLYWLDEADVSSVDNGGTVIVAADGGRWKLVYGGEFDILQWGAKRAVDAPSITINNAVFATVRNYINAQSPDRIRVNFPTGTYGYSVSPNLGIQNAEFYGIGEVHLEYHGTGNAIIIDGTGQPGGGCYNNKFYNFVIDAPTTALHGVAITKSHHGLYRIKVRGAGVSSAGIYVDGCVCSRFDDPEVSPNADGVWYTNATPQYGMLITGGVGFQTSYCTFINPVMEGLVKPVTGAGILLGGSFGNFFISGTCEGCVTGIATSTPAGGCVDNKMWGMDFEANSVTDIYEQGEGNEWHSCNSTTKLQVISGATTPQFFGGRYMNIEVAAGVNHANFIGVVYNRNGLVEVGTFANGSPSTSTINCVDEKNLTRGPYSQFTVTVSTGTFTHTNNTGNSQLAIVTGGTSSVVAIRRAGVDNPCTNLVGEYMLAPGDAIKITSTVAPGLRILTQ